MVSESNHPIGSLPDPEEECVRDPTRERDVRAIAVVQGMMVLTVLAQGLWEWTQSSGIGNLGGYVVLLVYSAYALFIGWGGWSAYGLWRFHRLAPRLMMVWLVLQGLVAFFVATAPFPFLLVGANDPTSLWICDLAHWAVGAFMLCWWGSVVFLLGQAKTRRLFMTRYRQAKREPTLPFYRSPYFHRLLILAVLAGSLLVVGVLACRAARVRSQHEAEMAWAVQQRKEAVAAVEAKKEEAVQRQVELDQVRLDAAASVEKLGDPYMPLYRVKDLAAGDWEELKSQGQWIHRYEIGSLEMDVFPVRITASSESAVFRPETRWISRDQPVLRMPSSPTSLQLGGKKFLCQRVHMRVQGQPWCTAWVSPEVRGIGVVAIDYPSGLRFELSAYGRKNRVMWRKTVDQGGLAR